MSAAVARDAHLVAALHEGVATDAQITWHTTWVLGPNDVDASEPLHIELAVPLDEGVTMEPRPFVRAEIEGGRIVAFVLQPEAVTDRDVSLVVHQPRTSHGAVHLAAPLVADTTTQIVDLSGDAGARFEPAAWLGLERHVGFYAPPSLSLGAREDADRLVASHRHDRGDPVYLTMNGALAAHGLEGTITTSAERSRAGVLGAAAAFALVVAILVVAWKKLSWAARAEEAEAALRAEYEHLEEEDARVPAAPRV